VARIGARVMVHLPPPYLLAHTLPLDPCYHLEVLVPHLDLGVASSLRKKVDLVLVVPMATHLLLS
jgi:hypothetical protein